MPGIIHLPIWVDNDKVSTIDDLKKYKIGTYNNYRGTPVHVTLYSIYKKMPKDHITKNFIEYVQWYCDDVGLHNPFKLNPLNPNSSSWKSQVRELIQESGSVDMVVNKLLEIIASDNKQAVQAIALLGKWMGMDDTQKIELKGDMTVDNNITVKEPLFNLNEQES